MPILRGDSAYGNRAVVRACVRGKSEFSLVMIKNRAIQRAIAAIPDTAWTPVRYPGAVQDPDTGAWISDAEVAEVPYTAFAATQDRITARLVTKSRSPARPSWGSRLRRRCLDGKGEIGEDRLESAAGLGIDGEFVVSTAEVLDECMSATDT